MKQVKSICNVQRANKIISCSNTKISFFLLTELEGIRKINKILKLLYYYPLIYSFIRISAIKDKDKYERDIVIFKSNLMLYQEAASKRILVNYTVRDNESLHSYIMFYYYLKLIGWLWKSYKVGIKIFSLQRFKRRNKELKNAARHFYNGKHNIYN